MSNKPPFILAFAADSQGCGFHRVMTPLASLVSAGVANGRIDSQGWDDAVAAACAPDVVVWQRQVEDSQIAMMSRWRVLLPNAVFVFELDDYLDEIPPASFHASFMPPDIRQRIIKAIAICDRVTTSTRPMAAWLRSLLPEGSKIPVLIVPNALPAGRLQERAVRLGDKLRIGFCGGMSHDAPEPTVSWRALYANSVHHNDLELIKPAMAEIGDAVEWVFFGTKPDNCPVEVEYHQGLPASMYLDKLASLDMNLMLAPLEANRFNECKSNLRILEAVVAGAAVIAQDAVPYRENTPPVRYADTPDSWTRAIRAFLKTSVDEQQNETDLLRAWAERSYTLERILATRMQAWLPEAAGSQWWPKVVEPVTKTTVACQDPAVVAGLRANPPQQSRFSEKGLETACNEALLLGTNVLWLRPGTVLSLTCLGVLRAVLARQPHCAAVIPLASDGWNAFPQTDHWVPLPQSVVDALDEIVAAEFEDVTLPVQTPAGPVACLSLRALKLLGVPDVAGNDGNEEQAILEWGLNAAAREWPTVQAINTFASSSQPPVPATQTSVTRLQARGYGELLKTKPERVLTAASRQKIEIELLKQQWGGPRPGSMGFDNTYESWSLLRDIQRSVKRNAAPERPDLCRGHVLGLDIQDWNQGDWVVFLDDRVSLQPQAKAVFNKAFAEAEDAVVVIYADHETVAGNSRMPEFKPDFDRVLLMAIDYVTPVCAIRSDAITGIPANRLALFANILTILREQGGRAFSHIPQVLATMHYEVTPEAMALETVQRQNLINRLCGPDLTVAGHPQIIGALTATWTTAQTPSVCIVIPTLGYSRLLEPCIKTILQHTDYPHYEILVVQNGVRAEPDLSPAILALPNIRVIYWGEPFNWAAVNNYAVEHTRADYIVTMNDDVCVAGKTWLTTMLAHAVQPDVGAVGAKLIHPAGVLQHVGVVCHKGIAGHLHKGQSNGVPGYMGRALLSHEAAAVTGACMLFSRSNFDRVGGFNEDFAMNYNDTVFCLELRRHGLRNVVEMAAELLHPEASTRPTSDTPEGHAVLSADNLRLANLYPEEDPYWNSNLQIQPQQNGLVLQGLNADMLAWDDFIPRPGAGRVLLINDLPGTAGLVLDVMRAGDVPFMADLSGFKLRLAAPAPVNVAAMDVRNARELARTLQALGINRIVLRSLVGADGAAPPIETLRTLATLRPAIAVEIDALEVSTMAPWLSEDTDFYGYDDESNAVFGYVDLETWKSAYDSLVA